MAIADAPELRVGAVAAEEGVVRPLLDDGAVRQVADAGRRDHDRKRIR